MMKTKLIRLALGALLISPATLASAGNITVKGSDTMVILAQKWAETYMGKNAGVKIQVTGGGSGVGLAALQNNQTDIANSSRPIKPAEITASIKAFNKKPREYKVCLDGLSVYVNSANPLNELSLEQVEKIFTGKVKNWKEVGGQDLAITVISRENSSGTYEFFKEHVLKGQDFAASAQTMAGTAAVLQSLSKEPKAIGYGGAAYGLDGAKVLKIKKDEASPAIEPTEENVLSGKYPIWRYLNVYLNPDKDKSEIAAYLNWIRSDEGQKVVKDVGYYPLPANMREN